jgi:TRAP-type C4-dicarboxylate transport system permease small subunit
LAFALSTKAHIRIEVVYNALSMRLRACLDVFSYAVLSAAAGVLLYWCAVTVFANAQSGARSNSALSIPLAIPQGLWLAGLAWFALVAIICTGAGVWTLLRRGPQATTSLLGVASLQEEIEANAPDLPAPAASMERAA